MFGRSNSSFSEPSLEEAIFDEAHSGDTEHLSLPMSQSVFLLVAGVSALTVSLAVFRAGFLSFTKGVFYVDRARANVTREVALPAYRAEIIDRYGTSLAKNTNSFSVFLNIPSFLLKRGSEAAFTVKLATILHMDEHEISDVVARADLERDNWVPIARGVSNEEAIEIRGLNTQAAQVMDDYERTYPDGRIFAHVIGYTGVDQGNAIIGKSGLEYTYDKMIRGEDGQYAFFQNAKGKVLDERVVRAPKAAEPFQTTIDADLQRYFYHRLQVGLESLSRTTGVGIAIDPRNGEVLSLVSFPSFDANIFVDHTRKEERAALLSDAHESLFDRAISGTYSPGSTIKPLVALAGLREGVINESDEIYSSGALTIPNPYDAEKPSVFLDWKAHGWVNLTSALARSSNIYFYLLGGGVPPRVPASDLVRGTMNVKGLGIERLKQYWRELGFEGKTGIDVPFEAESFLPDPIEKKARTGEPWRLGDTYNASIGQGDFLITPIQLVSFMASLANGGTLFKPHLFLNAIPERIADHTGWTSEIAAVKRGLEDAVSTPLGSSHVLADLPITVAGKTGTPQIANKTKINALFVGYAPADNPEIAILVLIENAREGSANALPVAHDVLRWYYENRMAKK